MANNVERKRIVLIGTTGTGKSSLGNAILGLDTGARSLDGFEMSPETESCTLEVCAVDGFLQGDRSRPVRMIDTPGHGDGQGNDEVLRENLVKGMRQEKLVHAFVWAINSECPRFTDQDRQFMWIFSQMFGRAFANNLVIVFTRYSHSEEAERKRQRTGASLERAMNGFAKSIGPAFNAPMIAIDACHNHDNAKEVKLFEEACGQLWHHVQKFSAEPVEHVEVVKDKMTKLMEQISMLTQQVQNMQEQHSEERAKWEQQLQEAEARHRVLEEKINKGPSWFEKLIDGITGIVEAIAPRMAPVLSGFVKNLF